MKNVTVIIIIMKKSGDNVKTSKWKWVLKEIGNAKKIEKNQNLMSRIKEENSSKEWKINLTIIFVFNPISKIIFTERVGFF